MSRVVMLVSDAFDPDVRVYNESRSLLDESYSVKVIAWDRMLAHPEREVVDGIEVERVRVKCSYGRGIIQAPLFLLFWVIVFFKLLREDFSVVHCHDLDTLFPGFLAAKIFGKRVVYDVHDVYSRQKSDVGYSWLAGLIQIVDNFFSVRVDLIITASKEFQKIFPKSGVPRVEILNTKRLDEYERKAGDVKSCRKSFGPEGKTVFLYLGSLNPGRMVYELIDIFERVPEATLVIGGKGLYADKIQKQCARSDSSVFLGFVEPGEVSLYTLASDVVVWLIGKSSSNLLHTLPNKLFEAIAAGKPILTSSGGCTAEFVQKHGIGVTVDTDDSDAIESNIRRLCNPESRRVFEAETRKIRNDYNWSISHANLVKAYSRMMG